ncbi:MAG: malonyl-CoA decarboxylase N-terminal domain-containing protein, partial [Spongiibacter sp.]
MPTVNTKLSRWKQSVQKYLFAAPAIGKAEKAELTLEEFRREAQTCIDAPFGEVDARNRAARLGAAYAAFDEETRAEVLLMLLREFGPDRSEIDRCIERYQQCRDDDCEGAALALSRALQPRRMALLTRFTSLP